jgi:hypothetical protein
MTQDILGNSLGKTLKGKPIERGNFIRVYEKKILEIIAREIGTGAP